MLLCRPLYFLVILSKFNILDIYLRKKKHNKLKKKTTKLINQTKANYTKVEVQSWLPVTTLCIIYPSSPVVVIVSGDTIAGCKNCSYSGSPKQDIYGKNYKNKKKSKGFLTSKNISSRLFVN